MVAWEYTQNTVGWGSIGKLSYSRHLSSASGSERRRHMLSRNPATLTNIARISFASCHGDRNADKSQARHTRAISSNDQSWNCAQRWIGNEGFVGFTMVKGEHEGLTSSLPRVKLLPKDWSISRARFLLHEGSCYSAAPVKHLFKPQRLTNFRNPLNFN